MRLNKAHTLAHQSLHLQYCLMQYCSFVLLQSWKVIHIRVDLLTTKIMLPCRYFLARVITLYSKTACTNTHTQMQYRQYRWTSHMLCSDFTFSNIITISYQTHHTHTHPFNGPFSRTTQVSRYQKGKTNLDLTEARDSEWQWHQLGMCKSAPCSRQITTPAPHRSVFLQAGCPSCRPTKASTHWRDLLSLINRSQYF